MALQTYNFSMFRLSEEYQDNSTAMQFGGGYRFVTKPKVPNQNTFVLSYQAMRWFTNTDGTINRTINSTYNIAALIDFYNAHQLYEYFNFPHPARGTLRCRFKNPLIIPQGIPNGQGVTEPFQVKLIHEP